MDQQKEIILTSPCLPKKSYHCGNAVSDIVGQIVFLYSLAFVNSTRFHFVSEAWNLHGLPFERLYEETYGKPGTYETILTFAHSHIQVAQEQKQFFSLVEDYPNLVRYSDTNPDAIRYAAEAFWKLHSKGYIRAQNGECALDLASILRERPTIFDTSDTNIVPPYHAVTIMNDHEMIRSGYPLTKSRIFSPQMHVDGTVYSLNPIFQSFIYPSYMAKTYGYAYPTYAQFSSSGHGMLKWHYLRTVLSRLLDSEVPYRTLLLHGNILGADGKRMSKHGANVVQPSDLFTILPDKRFVRHTLIRSISEKDVPLQIDLSLAEFRKIQPILDRIEKFPGISTGDDFRDASIVQHIQNELARFRIKNAFDSFYLALRKMKLFPSNSSRAIKMRKLVCIFYGTDSKGR